MRRERIHQLIKQDASITFWLVFPAAVLVSIAALLDRYFVLGWGLSGEDLSSAIAISIGAPIIKLGHFLIDKLISFVEGERS